MSCLNEKPAKVVCPSCHSRVELSTFCTHCGSKLVLLARKPASVSNVRGGKFERWVEAQLKRAVRAGPRRIDYERQFEVKLARRTVKIDFRLTVHLGHEVQNYYLEVQSRRRHDHDLIGKIDAIRRESHVQTFRFVR